MQLSRLYSNVPAVFSEIDFNCGDEADLINVVFGEVHKPKDNKKDSHNLGKTTLIYLIDFMLLKGTWPELFLVKHADRFNNFAFCLEVLTNSGAYATIKRSAANPNSISLKRHENRGQNLIDIANTDWDHFELSREDALKLLDGWFDLRILKPYDFRQAITYFLRTQVDYRDELQLAKFAAGKDRHWKPFVAHLFGFDESAILRKYELDEKIASLKMKQSEQESSVQFTEEQQSELHAKIRVLQQEIDETESALDEFSFEPEERRILRELVDTTEVEASEINDRLYNIRFDVGQIDAALNHKDKFDLDEVVSIYEEAKINFPAELKRSYEELVEFNKKITHERNAALRGRKKTLLSEAEELSSRKRSLDELRSKHLRILQSTDTFEKFKALQKGLSTQRGQLVYLQEQSKLLERVVETARLTRETDRERGSVVDEIKAMVEKANPLFERFSSTFNSYCQKVLNHKGIFYFKVNSSGNFDYEIGLQIVGQATPTSSLSEGTSYKKLLCALFDLALLKVYEGLPFFHFVYHDGIFEALDDRKKITLLNIIREQISNKKTQYILSLIESDLPRDSEGNKVKFSDQEIVVHLHDDGNEGRLFKMAQF